MKGTSPISTIQCLVPTPKQVGQADDSDFALTREITNHHFVLLKNTA
jgi:hypothetical protein